jgi:ATP-binding cassette subfamily B protein
LTTDLGTADLIAFILYSEMVTGPFVALSTRLPELAKARAAYRRITAVLHESTPDPMLRGGRSAGRLPISPGPIEFRNVRFSYEGVHDALAGASFVVQPGETVALVGPSGAGKSTIIRLIPRLYDPQDGAVAIDGKDLRDIDVGDLRSGIGVVPQDPFLFNMTIAQNIACGNVDATAASIEAAARRAHVTEFTDAMADGLDTVVGDGGSRLSGGQRQRIAIARAFLKNPSILLLDEATSALDTRAEAIVRAALEELRAGRTTFVIAHNPKTFRTADRIIVVERGLVAAIGTHEELMESCRLYRDLAGGGERGSQRRVS